MKKLALILTLVFVILVSSTALASIDRVLKVSEVTAENPAIFKALEMTELAAKEEEEVEKAPVTYLHFGEKASEEIRLYCIHTVEPEALRLHDFYVLSVEGWAPYEKEAQITFETEGGYSKDWMVVVVFGVYDAIIEDYNWFAVPAEVIDGEHVRVSLTSDQMDFLSDKDDIAVAILTAAKSIGGGSGSGKSTPSKQLESCNQAFVEDERFSINFIMNRFPVIDECAKMYKEITLGKPAPEYFPVENQQQIAALLPDGVTMEDLLLTEVACIQVEDYKPEYGDQTVKFEFITDYEKDQTVVLVFGICDEPESEMDWVVQPAIIVDGDVHNRVQTELEISLIERIQNADTTGMFVLVTEKIA